MTNDEACKWLANLRQDIGNPHYERLWGYEQAICEIMSMLEEQEPIKPVCFEHRRTRNKYQCGNCGSSEVFKEWKYCPWCGRELKWNAAD